MRFLYECLRRKLWVCDVLMFKKYPIANPRCSCFHNVNVETPMVLHCHADVESYVAMYFILVLSGSMNTLLDGRPVSWKQSISFSAPAPDVQPVSKMPVRFAIFCFHFSAILFFTFGLVMSDKINNRCLVSTSSCSSTRQDSGDQ
jgi:hypothetical protein